LSTWDEDGEEDAHRHEAETADGSERDRPREEEGDLEVEDDEEDGDEVVAHIELHARLFEGLEAALVGGTLLGVVRCAGRKTAEPCAQQKEHDGEP